MLVQGAPGGTISQGIRHHGISQVLEILETAPE